MLAAFLRHDFAFACPSPDEHLFAGRGQRQGVRVAGNAMRARDERFAELSSGSDLGNLLIHQHYRRLSQVFVLLAVCFRLRNRASKPIAETAAQWRRFLDADFRATN
jgi:hypothetical protein